MALCQNTPTLICEGCKTFLYCSQTCFEADNHPVLCSILTKYAAMRTWTWDKHKGDPAFVAFRKEFVDALIQHAMEKEGCSPDECTIIAAGSTNLTSDYDVTITGPHAAQVVARFNQEFKKFFNDQESAVVFDTNIYGAGFFEPIQLGNFDVFGGRFKYVRDAGDVLRQRTWALLKVYPLFGDRKETRELLSELAKDNVPKDDIAARNRAYEDALAQLAKLKKEMATTQKPDYKLRRRYKDAISRANYYASEAYYTQGAFMHVVGEIQGKLQNIIPITKDEYMDSFIENMGDALKHNGDAKYVARAMDALIKHGTAGEEEKKLFEAAEAIRTAVRGKPRCGEKKQTAATTECVLPKKANQLEQNYRALFRGVPVPRFLKDLLLKATEI